MKTNFPQVSNLDNFINIDESKQGRELQFAENRLSNCEICNSGEECLNYNLRDPNGNSIPEDRAGEFPASVSNNGEIQYAICTKWKEFERKKRIQAVGIPPIFVNCTLDNFKPQNDKAQKAHKGCREFVRRVINRDNLCGLFLNGPFGTGKTHLAAATLIELVETGIPKLKFVTTPMFLASIRKSYKDHNEQDHLENAAQANILILDDIGNEKMTDWAREQIYLLINERYENRKFTIITSNANLKDLEGRIGGAAMSRIHEMCTGYILDGDDYRKKK